MYSVIISSYGRYEYLNDLLQSIMTQTIKSNEIILILDSQCQIDEECLILKQKYKDVIFFFRDLNLPEKRNFGVQKAKNEIIFFSDDDDIWYPDKAELVLQKLNQYDVVTHNFDKFGYINKKECSKIGNISLEISPKFLCKGENIFGGGSSLIAKKKIFLNFNFNEKLKLAEDFDWWIRVILAGSKIYYISKSLVSYRTHSTNMTNNVFRISIQSVFVTIKYSYISFYGTCLFFNSLLRNSVKLLFALILSFKK